MPDPHIIDLPGDVLSQPLEKYTLPHKALLQAVLIWLQAVGCTTILKVLLMGQMQNGTKITVDSFNQTTTLVDSLDTLVANAN